MKNTILLLLVLIGKTALFAQTAIMPNQFYIYDVKTQKRVDLDTIVAKLQKGDVLFFGEQHDDSIAHSLQVQVLELMYNKFGRDITLSMEMFQKDVQPVVNEYLDGLISEKNFIKESRAWNNYNDYKPMIEFAKLKQIDVLAANAPSRYTNVVTTKGLGALTYFPKNTKQAYFAPLPIDTLTGAYYERFLEVMGGHEMPGFHMYQSQNFWDATMAHSVATYKNKNKNKNKTILHLNGRFHSDYFDGTASRIKNDYKQNIVVISSFYQDNLMDMNWEKLKGIGDYVIVTRKFVK